MTTNQSPLDRVNELYEKYKNKFLHDTFYHALLCALLANKTRKITDAAFVPAIKNGGTELGIADKGEKGFSPTNIFFISCNYDEQQEICTNLNRDIFNISEEEADEIIITTMGK